MSKRKSRANRPVKKPMPKFDTVFCCPFCNHSNTVACHIDKKQCIGELGCSVCLACFATKVTSLTEPVDIYAEWIDECEWVNKL